MMIEGGQGAGPIEERRESVTTTATVQDAAIIRDMIGREDAVLNSRLTWCGTIEGLFMAALAFGWEKAPPALVFILAFVGILVAVSTLYATVAALRTMQALTRWWSDHKSPDYRGPGVIGREIGAWEHQLLRPSLMLPLSFIVAWTGVVLVRWST